MGKRGLLIGLVVVTLAVAAGSTASPAVACTDTGECGVPWCSDSPVRVRPDMPRVVAVWCSYATGGEVTTQPQHGTVSAVEKDLNGIRFTVHMAADAPAEDSVTLHVTGPGGSADVGVPIRTIPLTENKPPYCEARPVSVRTEGAGPAEVLAVISCYDPDGDEFVVRGGGPGEHLDSPKEVTAATPLSSWRYRTAISSGTETAWVWATDVLGARSADAAFDVTVGPDVDEPPTCRPNNWGYPFSDSPIPIYSRPGIERRFGVGCSDVDHDAVEPILASPPARGQISSFVVDPLEWWADPWSRYAAVTYTPRDLSPEPDPFSVAATTSRGTGPETHLEIIQRPLPDNGGGGCWWPVGWIPGETGVIEGVCNDDEGDPLTAAVTRGPEHGVVDAVTVVPNRFGDSLVDVTYTPDPGFVGLDCVTVVVEDGHGFRTSMQVDIEVLETPPPMEMTPPEPPPVVLPPVESPPGLPPGPPPTSGNPGEHVRAAAAQALGTTAIRRIRRGSAEVWVRKRLSRRELLRGSSPMAFVVCSADCTMRSDVGLARRRSVVSRARSVAALEPWQPRLVSLSVAPNDRPKLRAARLPRARLKLVVRPRGGRAGVVASSIRIGA